MQQLKSFYDLSPFGWIYSHNNPNPSTARGVSLDVPLIQNGSVIHARFGNPGSIRLPHVFSRPRSSIVHPLKWYTTRQIPVCWKAVLRSTLGNPSLDRENDFMTFRKLKLSFTVSHVDSLTPPLSCMSLDDCASLFPHWVHICSWNFLQSNSKHPSAWLGGKD